MRPVLGVLALAAACQVYGPSLLVDGSAGDGGLEACTSTCNGSCVDLQNDQNNCGTCGTACETGCASGLCKPTVLATGLTAPHGIVVNGAFLYVANNGSINVQVMSKLDGTGLKNFASSLLQPDRLATDGTLLYWTDDTNLLGSGNNPGGSIWEAAFTPPTPSCTGSSCYYVRDLPSPYAIAVHGSTMFFTTLDGTNKSGNGCPTSAWTSSVLQCPITGCYVAGCNTVGGPTVIASNQTKLAGITADAQNVYWADFGGKEVRFCPQPNCTAPKTFAQNLGGPFDVLSDGKTVYFSDRAGGALYSCPTSGCGTAPKQLASGLTDPFLLATDGTTLYATLFAQGEVVACTLPDCTNGPTTIAAGLHGPYGITTDATYVYWSEEGSGGNTSTDGTVSKLRKM